MAVVKKKYIAKVDITFDQLDTKVKAGDPIPEKLDQKTIDMLLKDGDIEAAKGKKKSEESE